VSNLSAGDHGTCALSDGRAYCWGVGWSGLMGNGTETPVNPLPVAVDADGALAGITLEQLSVGGGAACAVSTAGRVYCWGAGSSGQLGVGSYTDQLRPVAMRTSGVLADTRVRLLGAGFQTWLVTG
jgi:alpha-tubulin suppressor-like RCC1 family protein